MNKILTPGQVEQFRKRGYIKGIRVWDEDTVARARAHFEGVTAELAAKGLTHNDVNGWWAINLGFWNFCQTPSVLNCLEDLLGPDLFLWGGQYFYKAPHDASTVPWHQDTSYWPLAPREHIVTAWIALYDTDGSNGCMQVMPGSHKQPVEHDREAAACGMLDRALFPARNGARAVDNINLKAGEMSLHCGALIHGSQANGSDGPRCGMTMRVSSPDVKADLASWPIFHWIRLHGTDPGALNPLLDPPETHAVPTGYNQFCPVWHDASRAQSPARA